MMVFRFKERSSHFLATRNPAAVATVWRPATRATVRHCQTCVPPAGGCLRSWDGDPAKSGRWILGNFLHVVGYGQRSALGVAAVAWPLHAASHGPTGRPDGPVSTALSDADQLSRCCGLSRTRPSWAFGPGRQNCPRPRQPAGRSASRALLQVGCQSECTDRDLAVLEGGSAFAGKELSRGLTEAKTLRLVNASDLLQR